VTKKARVHMFRRKAGTDGCGGEGRENADERTDRLLLRAASGHAAAPPSSLMNWRRFRSSMGSSPEPAVPAYSRVRMHRKRPQVLGLDLNRSGSGSQADGVQVMPIASAFP
jgi:hypothetical protein